jgi:acyl-CoA synthetase (AMP-forming)/AMP-acid ligase II
VIVLREGHDTEPEALRAFCKAALAAYKVPQEFCLMRRDELPVTDTGKVQKARLAAMLAAKRAG